jgi:hypothetical protein
MNNIQGTQKVWITDSDRLSPRDIQEAIDAGRQEDLVQQFSFSNFDMSRHGWVELGSAKIEVVLHPQDEVIEKLADGLREQISIVRAEAQSKVAQLEEKLSQLLALPNPDQGETK